MQCQIAVLALSKSLRREEHQRLCAMLTVTQMLRDRVYYYMQVHTQRDSSQKFKSSKKLCRNLCRLLIKKRSICTVNFVTQVQIG